MNIQRFLAPTAREALDKARAVSVTTPDFVQSPYAQAA